MLLIDPRANLFHFNHWQLFVHEQQAECFYVALYVCIRPPLPLLEFILCGLKRLLPLRPGPPAHWPSISTFTTSKNRPTTPSSPVLTFISATTALQILVGIWSTLLVVCHTKILQKRRTHVVWPPHIDEAPPPGTQGAMQLTFRKLGCDYYPFHRPGEEQ